MSKKYIVDHIHFNVMSQINLREARKLIMIKRAFKITDNDKAKKILHDIDNNIPIELDELLQKEFEQNGLHGYWSSKSQIIRSEEEEKRIREWNEARDKKSKMANDWYVKLSKEDQEMVELYREVHMVIATG